MPGLADEHIVTLGEGVVPIVEAGPNLRKWLEFDLDLWLILEGKTASASFKDFGMTALVSVAKAAGVESLGCSSTGDTSASAAAYSAKARIICFVLLPAGQVTFGQILQVELFGARVIILPGNFDECMRVLLELVSDYGVYPANSLNPARIEGHQATVFLTAQFFDWQLPDWFIVPIGNGSNCSSIGKALRLMKSQGFKVPTRILGCQCQAANPMYLSWQKALKQGVVTQESWRKAFERVEVGETIATAARIGYPVSHQKVIREVISADGMVAEATEAELREAVLVCAKDGLFVCPQTGIALAGLRHAVKSGQLTAGQRVVVVSTADGLKFTGPFINAFPDYVIKAPDCRTETVAKILNL